MWTRELEDRGRQVVICTSFSGYSSTYQREQFGEIHFIKVPDYPVAGDREFKNDNFTSRLEGPAHFLKPLVKMLKIPDPESC